MGENGVKELYKAINGEEVETFIDTGTVFVDSNNIEDVIKKPKPLE